MSVWTKAFLVWALHGHGEDGAIVIQQLLELPSRKLWSLMSLRFLWHTQWQWAHPKAEELSYHFHSRITWVTWRTLESRSTLTWIFFPLTQHRAFFNILVFDTRTSKCWTTITSHFEMGLWSNERFLITILFPCFALKLQSLHMLTIKIARTEPLCPWCHATF